MPRIRSHRDLVVWQRGMELVEAVYRIASMLPDHGRFALRVQLQRAAVSVVSNIAEGYARNHREDYRRFLGFSQGSVAEIEVQLEICEPGGRNRQDAHHPAEAPSS